MKQTPEPKRHKIKFKGRGWYVDFKLKEFRSVKNKDDKLTFKEAENDIYQLLDLRRG